MKKILTSALLASALFLNLNAAEYSLDKTHSSVNFKIKHMSVSNTSGKFNDFDAVIDAESNGKLNKLNATIKVASVDTDNQSRDSHLQAPDFFNASKFPNMTFEMSEFKKDKVIGNLTIAGVSKKVELDYEFGGKNTDQKGKEHIGFSLEGKIKRSDFNFAPSSSTVTLGDEIKISVEVEAIKK